MKKLLLVLSILGLNSVFANQVWKCVNSNGANYRVEITGSKKKPIAVLKQLDVYQFGTRNTLAEAIASRMPLISKTPYGTMIFEGDSNTGDGSIGTGVLVTYTFLLVANVLGDGDIAQAMLVQGLDETIQCSTN